jgi:cytidylate kinase
MYRAVAWKALHERLDLTDETRVAEMAAHTELQVAGGRVTVDGRDVSDEIRTPVIDAAAAAVARQPRVRQILVALQREMGSGGGIVMEGRDIGTVVFPRADVKIYLDAAPEERARRRANDPAHAASWGSGGVSDVATALEARDQSDRTRSVSPLTRAGDAVEIDTTGLSAEQVIERVLAIVERELEV